MACKFVATIDCAEGPACKFCGWNPSVAKRRVQAVRANRTDLVRIAKRLREYRLEYSKGCFRALAEKTKGQLSETMLERICDGQVGVVPKKHVMCIDKILRTIEKEVENGDCC